VRQLRKVKEEVKPMATTGRVTDEIIESQQNTDPISDPADALTTGVEGIEETSTIVTPLTVSAEEFARVKAERDQYLDRMARLQAEFDNARKRETRERADFRDFAIAGAIEQFLPVLDNFNLALGSGGTAEQLRQGVELIVKQMEEVLRSLNVVAVEAVGAPFDPRFHEALESVERNDVPDHQVVEEVRRGYRIKERLLRPALVRIASNPQQKES